MITESNIMFDIEANDFLESKGYSVEATIGHGGFASVYTVKSQKYKQTFVCKISSLKQGEEDSSKMEAFQNELDSLCKSYHPNFVQIYDHYIYKNRLYIIIEYCPNGSLQDLLKKNGPFSTNNVMQIMIQLASAINYLHSNNIAHLDIKPANILIDRNNKIKVSDFGLSKTFSEDSPVCTSKRGSVLYASPEVLTKPSYDPFKADIYSIGVTLYHLLTGKFPFLGRTISEVVSQQKMQIINYTDRTHKFKNIIKKCLNFHQEDRLDACSLLSAINDISKSVKSTVVLPILTIPKNVSSLNSGGGPQITLRKPIVSSLVIGKKRYVS